SFYCLVYVNAPALNETYTLSLHDALPICSQIEIFNQSQVVVKDAMLGITPIFIVDRQISREIKRGVDHAKGTVIVFAVYSFGMRSEEHTSELQSRENLVCRLLLEKKKIE